MALFFLEIIKYLTNINLIWYILIFIGWLVIWHFLEKFIFVKILKRINDKIFNLKIDIFIINNTLRDENRELNPRERLIKLFTDARYKSEKSMENNSNLLEFLKPLLQLKGNPKILCALGCTILTIILMGIKI